MIEAVVSEHVNAPADRVRALYRDTGNWARLFPATIRGARVVRKEGNTTMAEVDHVEGKVVNILRDISSTRTDLLEFKRHYDATFVNEFIPEQDHWPLAPQLTVDLGLRYDFERLPAGFNQDTNNASPRVGLAWSPSPKRVLRSGYGIFFDRYVLANITRAIEKDGSQGFEQVADGNVAASLFVTAQGDSLPAPAAGIARSIYRSDSRMATPYGQQASAGTEFLLAKNLTLRADYLFVHGVKLPRTLNVNLLLPVILTSANAASFGIPAPTPRQIGRDVFSPARLNPQFDDIFELQDSAGSTYNGVSLTLSRKMNEELEFSASYTLSKTFDDASDFSEQPQNPFNLRAENAVSLQHQHQRFVFNALWNLPIGGRRIRVENHKKAQDGSRTPSAILKCHQF